MSDISSNLCLSLMFFVIDENRSDLFAVLFLQQVQNIIINDM